MRAHEQMFRSTVPVFCGLAVAAAVLLAAGAARAQGTNAPCGALNSGNSFTANCPAAAYANGIAYWDQASGVTLTVPGAAAGTTITAAGGYNDMDNGVTIGTAEHATETRNVSLTVGGEGDVNIVQGSSPAANAWDRNHGILVSPYAANGSTITVDIKSDVKIGAADNKIRKGGVQVSPPAGAGAVTLTSAAEIHAGEAGLYVYSLGAAAIAVTNSGAIATGIRGIYAIDAGGSGGAITVTNSGDITSPSTPTIHYGIFANTTGKDSAGANSGVSITHSAGAISGGFFGGVEARVGTARREHDTTHADYVAPVNAGLAKVEITGGSVSVRGNAVRAINHEAGSVEVAVSKGVTLTSSEGHGIYAALTDAGNASGRITVTNAAGINAVSDGTDPFIRAQNGITVDRVAGSGDVSVTNSGAIRADIYGITAWARGGGGALAVTNSGALGPVDSGIWATHNGAGGSASLAVTNSGAIRANTYGVYASAIGADIAVTNSGALRVGDANARRVGDADARYFTGWTPPPYYGYYADDDEAGAVPVPSAPAWGGYSTAGPRRIDPDGSGIYVTARGAVGADGAFSISNSANIEAAGFGIVARKIATAGNISIAHSAGNIVAGGQMGILAAIGEGTPLDLAGDIAVDVTGGRVQASESRLRAAVGAWTYGTGSIAVNIGRDATLASRHGSGVYAFIDDVPGNTEGRIAFAQAGKIEAPSGVHAIVARNSGAAETRAAARQPVIDISWTGTYKTAAGSGRFETSSFEEAFLLNRSVRAREFRDIEGERGIAAEVMSWRKAALRVGRADEPAIADRAAADAILDSTASDASGEGRTRYALKTAVLPEIRKALASERYTIAGVDTTEIDTDGTRGLSDAELVAWLKTRDDRPEIMKRALRYAFTDEEAAVFRALVDGDDPTAALDALQTARGGAGNLPDNYRRDVMEIAGYYNVGDIRVAVNGGSIDASGDGVRAGYIWPNNRNGRIDIAVAEGATVAGGAAGIHVANAGMGEIAADSAWGRALYLAGDVTLRRQFVTVHGAVTGGTDAAVHLMGGGALLVGETGKVHAGSSGRAILVNDPGRSEIVIHGEVRGGAGAPAAVDVTGGGAIAVGLTGRVTANGATLAIRARKATSDDTRRTRVFLHVVGANVPGRVSREAADAAVARVQGGIGGDGVEDGKVVFVEIDAAGKTGQTVSVDLPDGGGDPDTGGLPKEQGNAGNEDEGTMPRPEPAFDCDMAELTDDRCRLYEALPSVLLAMNGLPTREERLAAARSEAGGWARVETSRGEWTADSSTRAGVAYDRARSGVRVGVDGAVGETGLFGVSLHGLRGSADMTQNGGKAELSGVGVSVSGAAEVGDGVYIDAQAGATRYDVKLTSKLALEPFRTLKDGATGTGYALAVEAGRPVAVGDGVTLTPRAGFVWSRASLGDFRDSRGSTVSMQDAESLTGRAGVRAEVAPDGAGGLLVFGSAEATHEFSGDTETQIAGTALKASAETTGARFALGAAHGWGDGRFALQASATYAAGGSDGDGFGGGLSLSVRF